MISQRDLDLIRQFEQSVENVFSIQLIGEEIKFCSSKSPTRVFLITRFHSNFNGANFFELIKHRSPELTLAHKGKVVSEQWIVGFLHSNAHSARDIQDITFENVPDDCEVLKKTEVKKVLRDHMGTIVTVFKDGVPQLPPDRYDGSKTRNWERHTFGVTNWYYDSW